MAVSWETVREGQELPTLEKQPGVTQLVKYAAGSGDFNPLHHDYAFPQAKQLGSIIVHGRFKYAALGELVNLLLVARVSAVIVAVPPSRLLPTLYSRSSSYRETR